MKRYLSLLATIASVAAPQAAHAYVLGAAGGAEAAPVAAQLGARTYRIVLDSTHPLDEYAAQIDAYRAQGMAPQLVIDGTGTTVRGRTGKNWQTINYAIHAFQRWPDAYSVSVFNEPNEAGIGACQYVDTFNRAYRMLKRAGAPRVLFGEWSPRNPLKWSAATIGRCHQKVTADGWAWHCYDPNPGWYGIGHAGDIQDWLRANRARIHTPRGFTLPMFCTEYGVIARYPNQAPDAAAETLARANTQGAQMWANALRIADRYLVQIVAWGVVDEHPAASWDSSLVTADGTPRASFKTVADRAAL